VIQTTDWKRTRNDNIPVACVDCPKCGKENVVARVASARSGFNSSSERGITCKRCDYIFAVPESKLTIRRQPREQLDEEYGVDALTWIA
jgi:hypothetical protein